MCVKKKKKKKKAVIYSATSTWLTAGNTTRGPSGSSKSRVHFYPSVSKTWQTINQNLNLNPTENIHRIYPQNRKMRN